MRGTPTVIFLSLVCTSLLLLFQLHVTSTAGMGYMTTLAGLWGNGMASAACALEAGTLYPQCWGNHPYLGDLSPPENKSFWAISSGGFFVCGLLYDSHHPSCWGQVNDSVIPSQFLSTSYSNINSGGYHACAVRDNTTDNPGLVDCWGNNTFGQASPPSDQTMISVTAGDFFTCGLKASTRHAVCWGEGNLTEMQAPNTSFESIFAGRYHMCGVELNTGKTLCWGNDTYGQATPVKNVNFTVITGGYSFSCGLRADTHEAVCWGETYFDSTLAPAGVAFATISSGDWFTCGVREDTDQRMVVDCWGTQDNAANNYVPTSLRAPMGLCVKQCNEDEYEVQDSIPNQCPASNGDKVCLECLAGQQCPLPIVNSTSPTPSISAPADSSSHRSVTGLVVGVVLGVIAALIGLMAVFRRRQLYSIWMSWRRPTTNGMESAGQETRLWKDKASKVISFTSRELRTATKGYDSSMVIGKGGFGDVYKGILADGQVVAIKKACSVERARTFDMELELLARLNHTYLVNLVGYCEEDKCLVFEFMANGSLHDCLFNPNRSPHQLLDWKCRMKIALQAARGLEYLHVYASPKIIHRDVKTSNILLDEALDAHISDFGLSIYGPVGSQSHLSNQVPCGTLGYLDPEYYQTGQLTAKSDVYSFGVVLLELLSGRQAVDKGQSVSGIVPWAMELAELGKPTLILDSELMKVVEPDEVAVRSLVDVMRLALQCVQITGKERPSISEVASCLQEVVKPTFFNFDRVQPSPLQSNYSNAVFSASSLEVR